MSNPSEPNRPCSICGTALPPGTLRGLCPKCLLVAGMEGEVGRHLHIRCPQCHIPIEIVDEESLREITCPSCDSHFSLIGDQTTSYVPKRAPSIGRFELLERVGIGAFGSVWRARDPELDRLVAVKIPRKEQLAADEVEQFLREARSAAQLQHSGIVSVHEVGWDGDRIYIVSDLISGITLAERLSAEPPTVQESAEWCARVADALDYAHGQGVIHRDLKPSNIMLDSDETPHVLDFGLAKRDAGELTMTVDGRILGTPAYMSPEQARGEAHTADARSDVYSLGVILFELLTGEKPFRGSSRMLLRQVVEDEPPLPRRLNAQVPRGLQTICLKCLAKDPPRRYQSAALLAADLQNWLAGRPIRARPIGRVERFLRWSRRNPAMATLAISVITLLAAVAAVSTVAAIRISGERTVAEQRSVQITVNNGIQQLNDGDLLRALPWLTEALRQDNDPKHEETHRMRVGSVLRQSPKLLQLWDEIVTFSSDGKTVVALKDDGTAKTWDLATEQQTSRRIHDGMANRTILSSDGRWAIAVRDKEGIVRIWDRASGKPVSPELHHEGQIHTVIFNPDCESLLTTAGSTAHIWAAATGLPQCEPLVHASGVWNAAFSPDGRLLATAEVRGKLRIWDVAEGQLIHGPFEFGHYPFGLSWSPDGRHLLTENDDGNCRVDIWNTETWTRITLDVLDHFAPEPAFSADSRLLVTYRHDPNGNLSYIQVWDALSGRAIGDRMLHSDTVNRARFGPDGRCVVTASNDGAVRVWDARTGRSITPPLWHQAGVTDAWFSPNGHQILTQDSDGVSRLWDIATDEPHSLALVPTNDNCQFEGTRDDGTIATHNRTGSARLWDLSAGSLRSTLFNVEASLKDLVFSPDGELCVALGEGDVAYLTRTDSEGKVPTRLLHRLNVKTARFSSNGKLLAVGADDRVYGRSEGDQSEVRVWDTETGRTVLAPLTVDSSVAAITVSADPSLVVVSTHDSHTRVWDTSTGQRVLDLAHRHAMGRLRFSPDGKRLLCAGGFERIGSHENDAAELWDLEAGTKIAELPHNGPVMDARFVYGDRIATASEDGTARVWDALSGKSISQPLRHPGRVWSVFTFDDRWLITSFRDHELVGGQDGDRYVKGVARWLVWDPVTWTPVSAVYDANSIAAELNASGEFTARRSFEFVPVREERSTEELAAAARLLSCRTADGLVALQKAEVLEAWSKFQAKNPTSRNASVVAWHQCAALRYVHRADWFAAKWHFDRLVAIDSNNHYQWLLSSAQSAVRLGSWKEAVEQCDVALELRPNDALALAIRGSANATGKQWERAAADVAAAIGNNCRDIDVWRYHAILSLHQLGRAGFVEACNRIWHEFGGTDNPAMARELVQTLVAGPIAAEKYPDLVRLVEVADTVYAFEAEHGAALFRTGEYEEAIAQLRTAIDNRADGGDAWEWLFLAMANQSLGNDREATKSLETAVRRLEEKEDPQAIDIPWSQRAEWDLLRREAELLVKSGKS